MSKKLETLAMGICTTVALSAAGAALYKMLEKENQDENKMSEWLTVTARPGKYYSAAVNSYDDIGLYRESSLYKDKDLKVDFDYIDPNQPFGKIEKAEEISERINTESHSNSLKFENPDEDKLSASQPKPDKKEPPKNSINKDAFINALLESRNSGRAGKK